MIRIVLAILVLIIGIIAYQLLPKRDLTRVPDNITKCRIVTSVCKKTFAVTESEYGEIESVAIQYEDKAALVLYENFGTAEILLSTERGARTKAAMESFFSQIEYKSYRIKVIGNADISEVVKNYDENGYCSPTYSRKNVSIARRPSSQISNECLAFVRAVNTSLIVSSILEGVSGDILELSFDPDPFMHNTNVQLKGDLYASLALGPEVERIRSDLQVPEGYEHSMVSDFPEIQERIRQDRVSYSNRLFPFRSVVILVTECDSLSCD